jgi:hypothetical protein
MKIKLLQDLDNGGGVIFPAGAVIEVGESDGLRLIEEKAGHAVGDHTPPVVNPEQHAADRAREREADELLKAIQEAEREAAELAEAPASRGRKARPPRSR